MAGARRLMPRKRDAILRGARVVFAREGYSRASVEMIAAEAAVSTRTIYNHFPSKEQLFSSVLLESATEVGQAFEQRLTRTCGGVDLEQDLIAMGQAYASQSMEFPDHFAVVRLIGVEAGHFPAAMLGAWQDAGPQRVRRAIAARLDRFAAQGLLDVPEPMRAALHFVALITAEITNRPYPLVPVSPSQSMDTIRAAVRAFLKGYGRR